MIPLRRRRAAIAAPRPVWDAPVTLTSGTDGDSHLISAAELDRTISTQASTYRTLCGRVVLAASLAAPPGPRCPACHGPHTEPATSPPSVSALR